MPHSATQQLDSIHAMLSAGQRNLCVERHSLVLWGASFGGLILLSDRILTAEQFPLLAQRALAWLILLALTVSGVGLLDWHLTRRAKQTRDEVWSFIHRQLLKVWWLLMAVGVLLTFATFFFGGGYMIFAAWVVLTGLGLYVHGLFSEELLEWGGALLIAIGIGMLALRLNFADSQRVAASALGLGLPLLAVLLDRGRARPARVRLAQSALWLACVLAPPLVAQRLAGADLPPAAPVVTLEQYFRQPAVRQVVTLPAGSTIPVRVDVSGDVFRPSNESVLPLVLDRPVEVLMNNGEPTGDWRFAGEDWLAARTTNWISIPWIKGALTPQQGPELRASLTVETGRHGGR